MRAEEEIRNDLKLVRSQKLDILRREGDVKQELAECVSKFEVGQRVLFNNAEYEIVSIRLSSWRDEPLYTGRKVLKSGALHKNTQGLFSPSITPKETNS